MRTIDEFLLTHSAKKSYEEKGICKLNWRGKWVTKEIPRDQSSEQMIKGIYFETLALGFNSGGEELPNISFMYDAKGNPKVELTRIHEQVDRFKELFNEEHEDFLGFKITKTQETIISSSEKIKGIIDFEAEDLFGNKCVFDLKFTADADNDRGEYAWGRDPSEIDWSQQKLYSYIYQKEYGVKPKMYVMVFDASPRKNIRLFELNISDYSTIETIDKYEEIWSEINKYEKNSWPINPNEKNCSLCPLECSGRYVSPLVKKIRVNM